MVLVIWVCIVALILMVMLAVALWLPAPPTLGSRPMEKRKELEGQMPLWVEEALDQMPFDDDDDETP